MVNSNKIITSEDNTCLKGAGSNGNEIFYSEVGWETGSHGVSFFFEPYSEVGNFYCGVVPDSQKSNFSSFSAYPYRSIFSSSFSKFRTVKGTDFIPTLKAGGRINFLIDVDEN